MPRLSPRVYVQQMLLVRSVWLMPKIWLVTEMAATLAHQWCEGLVGEEESQQHMRVGRSLVDSLWMQRANIPDSHCRIAAGLCGVE